MTRSDWLYVGASFAMVLFLLWRNLPGALLFLAPKLVRVRTEGTPASVEGAGHGTAIRQMLEEVEALGFAPLGLKWEQKPLGRRQKEFVFASTQERAWAGVMPVGNEAWLYFFTPLALGGAVITADFRWPSSDEPDYLAGGLPAATPTEVLAAHRRRIKGVEEQGLGLAERFDLAARELAARAFYAGGPGAREARRRELPHLLFAGTGLAWLGLLGYTVLRKTLGAG